MSVPTNVAIVRAGVDCQFALYRLPSGGEQAHDVVLRRQYLPVLVAEVEGVIRHTFIFEPALGFRVAAGDRAVSRNVAGAFGRIARPLLNRFLFFRFAPLSVAAISDMAVKNRHEFVCRDVGEQVGDFFLPGGIVQHVGGDTEPAHFALFVPLTILQDGEGCKFAGRVTGLGPVDVAEARLVAGAG